MRKRVKTWCVCADCKTPTPKSYMQVDHIVPKIPLDSSLEAMTWDDLIDRTWCDENNLQAICETCHDKKTLAEKKLRTQFKKGKKLK